MAVTKISLGIQDLNVRLTNIEKQNQGKPEAAALDISNVQRFLPLKSINDVTAFENYLSENEDEYNNFVSLIRNLFI